MEIIVSKQPDDVILKMANLIVLQIEKVLKSKPVFTLCLSGGNTPRKLYAQLVSKKYKSRINWKRIYFFIGDERFVPYEDERSNARMIQEVLLSQIDITQDQVHFFDTTIPVEDAVQKYEDMLRKYFEPGHPSFDLCLLGMGVDAHTLSIFPHADQNAFGNKWVIYTDDPGGSIKRLSLTPHLINSSASVAFLITGADKASAVKQVIDDPYNPVRFPAQLIKPASNNLYYFLDEEAAAFLDIDSENFLTDAFN